MAELSERAKQARKAYMEDWRKKNLEKSRKHMSDFWERIADKMEAQEKQELEK